MYPKNSKVFNPAFDITPNKSIEGLITNRGIIKDNKSERKKVKNDKQKHKNG